MKICSTCANCSAPVLDPRKCLYCGSFFQDPIINSIQNDQFFHGLTPLSAGFPYMTHVPDVRSFLNRDPVVKRLG